METIRYRDPTAFLADAGDWLAAAEAMNNLIFGIVNDAVAGRYEGDNYFALVHEGDRITGAAWRTPPWPVGVAFPTQPQALVSLLDGLWDIYPDDFQLMTTPDLAQVASRHFAIRGRPPLARVTGQGIFHATAIRHPAGVSGSLRPARQRDRDIVSEWGMGFRREAMANREEYARGSTWDAGLMMIDQGELYLWEVDGRPVSMAAARGATPRGIRISYVYTPIPFRRRGYASALTAAVSQKQLDEGRELCFLFTDLDNPTSNHIYQEVGYEYVGEMNIYGTR